MRRDSSAAASLIDTVSTGVPWCNTLMRHRVILSGLPIRSESTSTAAAAESIAPRTSTLANGPRSWMMLLKPLADSLCSTTKATVTLPRGSAVAAARSSAAHTARVPA